MREAKQKNKIILHDITRGRRLRVINLKPQRYQFFITLLTALLFVSLGAMLFFFGRESEAEHALLYPEVCLGNWINVDSAEGVPTLDIDAQFDEYSGVQAALYDGNAKQIFCGQFSGEAPAQASLTSATLKIVWAKSKKREIITPVFADEIVEKIIGVTGNEDVTTDTPSISVPEADISEQTENSSDAENIEDVEHTEMFAPLPEEAVEQPSVGRSIWRSFIQIASAQEEAAIPTNNAKTGETDRAEEELAEENVVTEGATTSLEEELPITGSDGAVSMDNSSSTTSSTSEATGVLNDDPDFSDPLLVSDEEDASDDDLFVITYSFDGYFWQELAVVSEIDFNKEFALPVYSLADIDNLQISIASLPPAEENIVVLLDGMYIEIAYHDEPVKLIDKENIEDESVVIEEPITEEEIIDEEVAEVEFVEEDEFEQVVDEAASRQANLKERKYTGAIVVDQNAQHHCDLSAFVVDLSEDIIATSTLELYPDGEALYKIEIGSLPQGIDVTFADTGGYLRYARASESVFELLFTKQDGAQTGNFSVPIIYTLLGDRDSSVICQLNVVNL